MEKLLIINGSPRAPRSNSKKYIEIFRGFFKGQADEYSVTSKSHEEVCQRAGKYDGILLVFPLYADALPAVLMNFLKELEKQEFDKRPSVHILINCGFLEPEQNDIAVDILKCYCKKNHFPVGMVLCIGSGEAILTTPFAFLVKNKIKKLARGIVNGEKKTMSVTMPISKGMFLRASTGYWISYGERHHITEEQMRTLKIESEDN